MTKKINKESPEFLARYDELKAIVAQQMGLGKIPTVVLTRPITREFLVSVRSNVVSVVDRYTKMKHEEPVIYYGYELSDRSSNKFCCLTEYAGKVFFGAAQNNKKDAKKACAMTILDYLVGETDITSIFFPTREVSLEKGSGATPLKLDEHDIPEEQSLLGSGKIPKGRKSQKLKENVDPSKEFGKKSPVSTQEVFEAMNPVPNELQAEFTKFVEIRNMLWELYTNRSLNLQPVSDRTQSILKAENRNPLQWLNEYVTKHKSKEALKYFVFKLPDKHNKFIAWTQFQEISTFGVPQKSKQEAKYAAAAYVIDRLAESGKCQFDNGFESANSVPADLPPEKASKFKEIREHVMNLYSSGSLNNTQPLSTETLSIIQNETKNPITLLNEYAAQHRFPKPDFYIFKLPPNNFVAWIEFLTWCVIGIPQKSKHEAKNMAAAYAIDSLVKDGLFKAEADKIIKRKSSIGWMEFSEHKKSRPGPASEEISEESEVKITAETHPITHEASGDVNIVTATHPVISGAVEDMADEALPNSSEGIQTPLEKQEPVDFTTDDMYY